MTATLYVEGGGDGRSLRARFREGWSGFFKSADLGGSVKIVRGGGREQTFNRFASAVASGCAGAPVLLLVDSEDPVAPGSSVWQHLHDRDGWTRPDGAGDDQAFLMVQLMETWFLADRGPCGGTSARSSGRTRSGNGRRWRPFPRLRSSKRSIGLPPPAGTVTPRAGSRSNSWRGSTPLASKRHARTPGRSWID